MLVKDVVQKTAAFFKDKGIDTPRLDAELLIARALKWERIQLYLKFDYPMSEDELSACRESVRRRAQGEPVAYIVGQRDFFNSTFHVEPGVLVPRPETEGLVEAALEHARARGLGGEGQEPFRVVDLGCGSGCIGLSVIKELPTARAFSIDASEVAVRVTEGNAAALELGERAVVRKLNVDDLDRAAVETALGGAIDAVLANPPYISADDPRLAPDVRKHEPALALFSEEGGLAHIRGWAAKAAEIAPPGAFVAFEIGAGQGPDARAIFAAGPFERVEILKDLAGHDRFIRAAVSAKTEGKGGS